MQKPIQNKHCTTILAVANFIIFLYIWFMPWQSKASQKSVTDWLSKTQVSSETEFGFRADLLSRYITCCCSTWCHFCSYAPCSQATFISQLRQSCSSTFKCNIHIYILQFNNVIYIYIYIYILQFNVVIFEGYVAFYE